ncbi:T-cell surface glycoprotein CD5 [Tachyglossus aculeatus]|uniref:T-cell surface glycoprotein CD5 n=1 Tax=Tachyglossus aculeatus TaxID=9261 RepID=UPI0018F2B9E8|nr:T-cell surface glycoprotein CD5 [Tachyglossus aculeatus]
MGNGTLRDTEAIDGKRVRHVKPKKTRKGRLRLSGSSSHCQGVLEVKIRGSWSNVCLGSWKQNTSQNHQHLDFQNQDAWNGVCKELNCGEALIVWAALDFPGYEEQAQKILCHGQELSFSNCSRQTSSSSCPKHLTLVCLEPTPASPAPTSPQPTTQPKSTGSPGLWLLQGDHHCSGTVIFYDGLTVGTISYNKNTWNKTLGNRICRTLDCGNYLDVLKDQEAKASLPMSWEIIDGSCPPLHTCFNKSSPQDTPSLAVVCSNFQPEVKSRLTGGTSHCSGVMEVFHQSSWKTLGKLQSDSVWTDVCQRQECGALVSKETLQDSSRKSREMIRCLKVNLSECYTFEDCPSACKGVTVTCLDPNPAPLGAGTVMSVILTLILMGILLVICGPPAYRKIVKKFRQKKQRQWIGPTRMNQNVSFHRNQTMTVRPQVENPGASTTENDYSRTPRNSNLLQPPRNSSLLAYPALEGALTQASNAPDNSSDSDYDLHGAQRL